jgi:hypothetical protein
VSEEINKGYYFELMDRCHVQAKSIDIFLLSNPHIQANKKMRQKLERAQELIMSVYQWAGAKDFQESEPKPPEGG